MADPAKTIRKKERKQKLYVFLIRWWSVGAVYFFIAWGTQLGRYSDTADLVFFLGTSIGLFTTLIVNPALKMLFNAGWHKAYGSSTAWERLRIRLLDVGLALLITLVVSFLYEGINRTAIVLLDLQEDQVFLPGEPILFGLFYTLILTAVLFLLSQSGKMLNKKNKDNQ
ncbi:MAG: hypothetical protein PQJ58_19710 [Spirochaetales bacterium]|nr:hypothetical protein [Spirochaetales bacterium]